MKIHAYAKINMALDVVSEREDGYHELKMIMSPISLHDLIFVDIINEGITITSNSTRLPTDERNIMYKVAQAIIDKYEIKQGVSIHCFKHIPTQAGLAGGSADGAAVIKAMNRLFHLRMSYQDMVDLGVKIGADIPFCIYNRIAIVEGIGEELEFIDTEYEADLLLVKPSRGVSTKLCFESLDMDTALHPDIIGMAESLRNNDHKGIISRLCNTLEKPSLEMVPEIDTIKQEMISIGFDGSLMSGSGSCVFGITQDPEVFERGFQYFKKRYGFVRKSKIMNFSHK